MTAPRQLPLPMRLRPSSVFASYYAGDNTQAVHTLQQLSTTGPSPVVSLTGAAGTGKTHLLQAVCADAGRTGAAVAYLPLKEMHRVGIELLAGSEALQVLCLDDVSSIAADRAWNVALFNLHRDFEERGAKLLLADANAPGSMQFALPDLASRILAGALLRLQPLNDQQQIAALQLHAAQRGFELPLEVAQYLLRRLPRDMHSLCRFIDELDIALLAAQRQLSVPFVRSLLPVSA